DRCDAGRLRPERTVTEGQAAVFSLEHLNTLRSAEIEKIVRHLRPPGARVLEIGAGTGQQARELSRRGFKVEAIEIPSSNYAPDRMFPIIYFDGRHISFPECKFRIAFFCRVPLDW